MPGICGGDRRVTCRAGCLNDLNTTRGQEQPEEAQDAADAVADAEAISHPAAAAQAAADDGTANEQTKQGAATRKRAAEPRDDTSEDQPRLARIPCPVC